MFKALPFCKAQRTRNEDDAAIDGMLLFAVTALALLGLVMVTSATISIAERTVGQTFYYCWRQILFLGVGLVFGAAVYRTRLVHWEKLGPALLTLGFVLLVIVLLPGMGKQVNGATRWLPLGLFNLQVSELVKLFVIVFVAGYMVRHSSAIGEHFSAFIKPVAVAASVSLFLLLEPDFGAAAVLTAVVFGMLFVGGVRLHHFGLVVVTALGALAVLALTSPYRLERLTGFMNPWNDPFASGFQLTQALIAFGRGEWAGVGLGASVQKLFYLPEAHTDFLFSVIAEELGLAGALGVILLFTLLVWRAFAIARRAERVGHRFAAYLAYGIGIWIGLQAYINIGVNMGVLPTKGLTLPFMSYGGSSIVVMCMAIGLLFRVDSDTRQAVARERLRAC